MEPDTYLDHLGADGPRLLVAARTAPDAVVPSCPEWTASDLVGHVAGVYEWVAKVLAERAQERPTRRGPNDFSADLDERAGEYSVALASVIRELTAVDPREPIWNWKDRAPAPARFWFRRMAQETVVHRVDAEQAAGAVTPIDPSLAADGIDEYLGLVASSLPREPVEGLSGSLRIVLTDSEASWGLELAPDRLEQLPDTAAEATVRGAAADVYLWLLNRAGSAGSAVSVEGDPTAAERWGLVRFD